MLDYTKIEDPLGDEFGLLVRKVIKLWQRTAQRCLDEFNITPSQMELMAAIVHLSISKIEPTQIALSMETNIDPMTTSTILRNLQRKGLITRKESKNDTRARIVELTEEGGIIFTQAVKKVKLLYDHVTNEEFDKKQFTMRLQSIYENLSKIYNHL